MSLENLIIENEITRALIIDDAYDMAPTSYIVLKTGDLPEIMKALHAEPPEVRAMFETVLVENGFEPDEIEEGLEEDAFILKLWEMSEAKTLTAKSTLALFEVFKADRDAKRAALEPLERLLKDRLKVKFDTQGTQYSELDGCQIVFLDLYLGETDAQSALDEAATRIKRMVNRLSDANRPLVFLMSTKGGVELDSKASELQKKASLLGCKFRTINKDEFEQHLPKVLESVLRDRPRAQVIAAWVDTWNQAITAAQTQFVSALRNLDLPDYSYLQKFRLNAEGIALGEYMQPTLLDFLGYCIESQTPISKMATELDRMDLRQAPEMHLLPSDQISELAHARAFIHRNYLEEKGFFLDDVAKDLQLGDVIVKLPPEAAGNQFSFPLGGLPAWVVITQACDIQQSNSDSFLLLRGTIKVRDWTSNISRDSVNTDVFLWNGTEYSIDWAKAQVSAIKISTMEKRLKQAGGYARIARFRGVEALRLQNLFASNLTRVGLPVSFHNRVEVGIELIVRQTATTQATIFKFLPEEKMAAIIDGRVLKPAAEGVRASSKKESGPAQVLAISPRLYDNFRSKIEAFGLENVAQQIRGALKSYIESTEDLKKLSEHHDVKKPILFGPNIKCDIFFETVKPDWKGMIAVLIQKPTLKK
ncbi:hypothetical protein [Rhizobium lentis]|uniref:hypothetical protein n=1 Tax=Rhizobium lentis TaxID=1138194 RepID=UPI001C84057B|nr:hypothetical protein [Rhizobium lentis]MBX5032707.1 hypothetical protein [Rhizobium lentis]